SSMRRSGSTWYRSAAKSICSAASRALWRVLELFTAFSNDMWKNLVFALVGCFHFAKEICHFDGRHRRFVTLVADGPAAAGLGLLFGICRDNTKHHGNACLDRCQHDPGRCLSVYKTKMRRFAADNHAKRDHSIKSSRFGGLHR